jgi:hypothetical protein
MENGNHGSLTGVMIQFFVEFFNFLKYIFHDVSLGRPPM